MAWGEQVFRYCERGQDPSFWAEPFNALSNFGFLLAAACLMQRCLAIGPATDRRERVAAHLLVALVAAVGIGSFLFHTFATRWSRLADVVPIGLFMVAYLLFALWVLLEWSPMRVLGALALFGLATTAASSMACPESLKSVTDYAREPCLKGTMGYVPALAALLTVGALVRKNPVAARRLFLAAGIFLAAMVLRWLDRDICQATALLGRIRGTHALWHFLTAAALYVLVATAIDALAARRMPQPTTPQH